jgi:ZIP family zinc transporter
MSGIALAALFGALSGAGLLAGAGAGLLLGGSHRFIAATIALASGLLLAAATLELARGAVMHTSLATACLAILGGAAAFSLVNLALQRWDAHKRKRCGECTPQPSERQMPGSGMAIAAGSLLDAIPEAMILGFAAHEGARAIPPLALIGVFAAANFAEGLSSTAGMRAAGRPIAYVVWLWSAVAIATIAAAIAGYALFASGADYRGVLSALAAGALIAMVVETMAPEAAAGRAPLAGVLTAMGFILFLYALHG